MAIFISAGHTPHGLQRDPGAVANGYTEAAIAMEFRDLVIKEVNLLGHKVIKDVDTERLGAYLARIKTGSGSVVLEFHCDAAANDTATGTTAIIGDDADRLDKAFGLDLSEAASTILGIRNRGVKPEAYTARKKLGLMRKQGTVCLLELFFLTNKKDLELYIAKKQILAKEIARILVHYEKLV